MNCETMGVKLTREEGHNMFVIQIKSTIGVISRGFNGTRVVEDSWCDRCVIINDGVDMQ